MSGRGKARKTVELIAAAFRILEEIQPASIRAVCYRLFSEGMIDNMSRANTNRVSFLLARAREAQELPWVWVVDETREAERINSWRDVAEFGDAVKRSYRRDYWTSQPKWLEVWSEKGTIRGTLEPVLDKYGLTFRVMHGHGSTTAVHAVAVETSRSEKALTVLYCGDWDPSGMHMSEADLPERLERYGGYVDLIRVAIAEEDTLLGAAVPSFSAHDKASDPRYRWFVEHYGDQCHELDALSPVILRDRIEAAIVSRLDVDAWDHAIKIEAAEIESMGELMSRWPTIPGPASEYSGEG